MPPSRRADAVSCRRARALRASGAVRRCTALFAALSLLLAAAPPATARQLSFRPVADASVNQRQLHRQFGKRPWLRVQAVPRWRAFLRFRVRGVKGRVTSARLVLRARRSVRFPRLIVRGARRPWGERRLTAARAPRALHVVGRLRSTRRPTHKVVVDVAGGVTRNGVVTFIVSRRNPRKLRFFSRERRRRAPRLIVRTAIGQAAGAAPAPAAGGSGSGSSAGSGSGPGSGFGGAASRPRPAGGIWVSRGEIASRPTSGPAWTAMKAAADAAGATGGIANQDSDDDLLTLAAALVAARTGSPAYREKARAGITAAIGSEAGGRTLALGRNLPGYVIAADAIDLPSIDGALDARFRAWLGGLRREDLGGDTLVSTHELRPNNWGTMAGAARIAADSYLGDAADLDRAAAVFRGWLGDRSAYTGFVFGDLSYQANPSAPVGVNPPGATKGGVSIDGALPDDMRRGCSFQPVPCPTDYAWEALQGAVVQAELLWRRGYDAWGWQSRALLRAATYLQQLDARVGGWWATADDTWQPWLINHAYGTSFPAQSPAALGKVMGFTDWTHP